MKTTTRSLNEGWAFRELDPPAHPNGDVATWLPAEVPGHVHLDLMRVGLIPDPFRRMHERTVQWVDETDWLYRCTFDVDADDLDGARHVLRCGGLDTVATIVLNDTVIGMTDNMFVAHEIDVTPTLQAGANRLEVRFSSAQRVGDERLAHRLATDPDMQPHRDSPYGRGLMSRSMIRKAQYMYGWDWGPRLRSCGIWRDVSLLRIPAARLRDWSWETTFEADGGCTVVVWLSVDGDAHEVEVRLHGHGVDIRERTAVVDGSAAVVLDIRDPRRWWCAGHGDQPLYDLTMSVIAHDAIADTTDARIGLREVELVREPDAVGESFFFRVNGVPVYAKGANWIPDDSFPSRTSGSRIRQLLQMARDCGMNMLRVWGGGLYESEDFYASCDELGLLVWQDLPYACALYPDDDATVDAAMAEARTAVRRLRNHTSLVLYCGNNENQWLAHLGLFGKIPRLLGERLYDEALPSVIAAEDPARPYWPSSPHGLGPDPSGEADGDCHYWNVWHGEGDWRHYVKCTARFVSEFGFSGPPGLRTLTEALDRRDLGVGTPAMRWHDKTNKGYETYLGFIALHYPMPTTLLDLVYYGQLNQADAMQHGIEHFRRLRPHTMGTLAWQLNDCWPVQSWAWIDYGLRPKAVWYAAKRFYAPLLLSLWRDGPRLRAHLVNDAVGGRDGRLVVRAVDADGTVLWSTQLDAAVGGCASEEVLDLEMPAAVLAAGPHAIVHASFGDVDATLLLVEPKELRLPAPEVRISSTRGLEDDGVSLQLETDMLALSLMLWLEDADATWSDNFFHLLPGETRQVRVRAQAQTPFSTPEMLSRLRWRALAVFREGGPAISSGRTQDNRRDGNSIPGMTNP